MASVARWVEVHRLAVAGREAVIARTVGDRVGRVWLARSRFADVGLPRCFRTPDYGVFRRLLASRSTRPTLPVGFDTPTRNGICENCRTARCTAQPPSPHRHVWDIPHD